MKDYRAKQRHKAVERGCTIDSCSTAHYAHGFCNKHYQRWKATGDPLGSRPRKKRGTCTIDGCEGLHFGLGYCHLHWQRSKRLGDAEAAVRPQGEGWEDRQGYRWVHREGRPIKEHRWVMSQHLNRPLLRTETVHHRNGDRLDNRLENLELWSTWQPPGQRVEDKAAWAVELLKLYDPDKLRNPDTPQPPTDF